LYLDGHTETAVQTAKAVRLEDLGQAVAKTGEFAGSALADVSGQSAQEKVFLITHKSTGK
jgi:hypothetical protein